MTTINVQASGDLSPDDTRPMPRIYEVPAWRRKLVDLVDYNVLMFDYKEMKARAEAAEKKLARAETYLRDEVARKDAELSKLRQLHVNAKRKLVAMTARAETAEAENEQLTRELGHEIDERQGFLTHIGLAVGLIYDDDTTQYDMAARIVAAIAALRAQVEGQGWRAWWSQRLTIDELIDYDDFPLDETIMAKVFVTSDGLKPIYVIHEWQPLPAPPDAQVT